MNLTNKNILVALGLNVIFLSIFIIVSGSLDVFTMILLSILPITVSLIISFVINKKSLSSYDQSKKVSLIYSIGNLSFLIAQSIILKTNSDMVSKILETSKDYSSEFVEVSANNNPIMTIIIFTVISFSLHYFLMNKIVKDNIND